MGIRDTQEGDRVPVYESEELTREKLEKLRRKNVCAVCGGWLNTFLGEGGVAFIACHDWLRTRHDGIKKEARIFEPNIPTRRKAMVKEYGEEKTTTLAKLPISGALTQPQAMHILKLVYPDVPENEIIRTAIFCRDFGLHPLAKEVYLIPFKGKHVMVVGIPASRKMAHNLKGEFSFLDDTPRAATSEEIDKQFGKDSEEAKLNVISVTKLQGEGGNLAIGFGLYPKSENPYGMDKGNTKRNMANIRSERQAMDRLPGKPLPQVEVIDEAYAEVPDIEGKVVIKTGEIIEGEGKVIEPEPEAEPLSDDLPEPESTDQQPVQPELKPEEKRDERLAPINLVTQVKQLFYRELKKSKDDLGHLINGEKKWGIKDLTNLKTWQANELIAIAKKELGEASK